MGRAYKYFSALSSCGINFDIVLMQKMFVYTINVLYVCVYCSFSLFFYLVSRPDGSIERLTGTAGHIAAKPEPNISSEKMVIL